MTPINSLTLSKSHKPKSYLLNLFIMPKLKVSHSILIEEKSIKIYDIISNFKRWKAWSPWLLAEPDCLVNNSKNGDFNYWKGEIIGEGKMTISEKSDNHDYLSATLEFLKPWKSKSIIHFLLKEKSEGTEVTWTMEGRLPIFLFWMKKSMEVYIGEDYRRGLNLLKDLIETGKTNSKIEFLGMRTLEGCEFIGIKRHCNIIEISHCMEEDFTSLLTESNQKWEQLIGGFPFAVYHKFDMVKGKVIYTAALPMKSLPSDLPSKYLTGKRPTLETYGLTHTGPYRHISNGWAAIVMHQRARKFKHDKKFPPIEIYLNSPKDTDELKLKTEILFPAKR
jgi:predicted transcriptional regulator YdeE